MRVSVLASGSKGNSTYIETNQHKFLVDLGMTASYSQWSLRHEDGQIYGDHGTFLPTAQL